MSTYSVHYRDYNKGSKYDESFNVIKTNVISLGETVIDNVFGISGADTASQGLFSYNGIVYKVYSLKIDSPLFNKGIIAGFDSEGNVIDIKIFSIPSYIGANELESIMIDTVKRKVYAVCDGKIVSFLESYLDFDIHELPRTLIKNENLNHLLGYGMYVAQNHTVASTIINYPNDIMTPEGSDVPEYHGFSIEVKPISHGSLKQTFTSFMNVGEIITAYRFFNSDENIWSNWAKE